MPTSIGHGWQKGPRNSPTVLNAVFNEAQFWDGRAADLKAQAKGPVQAGVEMANTPDNVVATLKSMPQYVEWFEAAFPGEDDPVSFDNMAKAIEAFEATLITPSPFDAYLNGDDAALTDDQKAGLASCSSTRAAPPATPASTSAATATIPFGLIEKPGADVLPPEGDKGRFAVTETATTSTSSAPRPAQHRGDRALLPLRQGLGSQGRRADHGRKPARRRSDRRRSRPDRRLPRTA
jgi:cytochrome c peroxidase